MFLIYSFSWALQLSYEILQEFLLIYLFDEIIIWCVLYKDVGNVWDYNAVESKTINLKLKIKYSSLVEFITFFCREGDMVEFQGHPWVEQWLL